MYESTPVEAVIKDLGGHVVNMSDARGINPVTNTGLVNARSLALSAAGGGIMLFRGGFTLAEGVIARDNVHFLLDGPDSYLKLRDAAEGAFIVGSAVSNFGIIGGRTLGNRENQPGTPGSGPGTADYPYILRLVDGCSDIILDTSIEDGLHFGAWIENAGDRWTVSRGGRNCSEGNSGIYYFISSGVRIARRFRFDGIDIDNSMASSGGLKMAGVNGAQFEDIDLGHGRYKIGDYGDTVGLSETLCVEFFSAHGGSFRGIKGTNLHFEGPNDTSSQTWGLSTGGGTVPPDSGDPFPVGSGGVHDVVIDNITTYRCRRQSVEVIGTNIAIDTVVMRDSAGIPMYPNELYADEGQTNISIGNIISEGHCNQEAVVSTNAFRGGVNGLTIGSLLVRNSIAPALAFVGAHTLRNFDIGAVIATEHKSWGVVVGSGVTLRDGHIGPVNIDFADSGVLAGADGLIHVGDLIENVDFEGFKVDGAPRYGFFGGGPMVGCTLNKFRPSNCVVGDIVVAAGTDLRGDWRETQRVPMIQYAINADASPSVGMGPEWAYQFGYTTLTTIPHLDDAIPGKWYSLFFTTDNHILDYETGLWRGRTINWQPPAGAWVHTFYDGSFFYTVSSDVPETTSYNTWTLNQRFVGATAGTPVQQLAVEGDTGSRVQTTAIGDSAYSDGVGSADAVTGRNAAGQFGMLQGSLSAGSLWNDGHFVMGPYHWWIHAGSYPRFKYGTPASDGDGARIPFQAAALTNIVPTTPFADPDAEALRLVLAELVANLQNSGGLA